MRERYRTDEEFRDRLNQRSADLLARNRAVAIIAKRNICWDCGGEFMSRELHFHHRDPATKVAEVSRLVSDLAQLPELRAEIAKCDVLCASCHWVAHDELRITSPVT